MLTTPEQPLVSVIIPTRDRPVLLRRAISTVLDQSYAGPLEVIVVFDHSEPDESLIQNNARRSVRVIRNDRSPGLAGGRNTGILAATGTYIAYLDDDDEWLRGKLEAQIELLATTPGAGAATCSVDICYGDRRTRRVPDPALMTVAGFVRDRMTEVHPSTLIVERRLLLGPVGLVDEQLPQSYVEDYDLLIRLVAHTELAVADYCGTKVWWHQGTYFADRWATINEALDYLIDKHPEFQDDPAGLARLRGQQAFALAAQHKRREAFELAKETFRLNWREPRAPLAAIVAAGLPAKRALQLAHLTGRGI